jgi:hypothetical protein
MSVSILKSKRVQKMSSTDGDFLLSGLEFPHVGVLKCLFDSESVVRVEDQEIPVEI